MKNNQLFQSLKMFNRCWQIILLVLIPTQLWSQEPAGKVLVGWVERISIADTAYSMKTKLDTGAKTSSIHAIDIEQFKRDGERWVRFILPLEEMDGTPYLLKMEKRRKRRISVKEHQGENSRRPVVELPICFNGKRYEVEFSLIDRSKFIYPALLGRRFLSGVAVVDSESTFLTQSTCEQHHEE